MKRIFAILLCTALLTSLAGCANSHYDEIYSKPDKKQDGVTYEYEGDTVRYASPDIAIEATYLSPQGLDMFFSVFKGGVYKSPFSPKSFMVFSLTILNKGGKTLTYDPKTTFVLTKFPQPLSSRDITSIYMDFELAHLEDARQRMEAVKAACFDTAQVIAPGQRVQRLIVFQRNEEAKNGARLVIEGLYTGTETRAVIMEFKKGITLREGE